MLRRESADVGWVRQPAEGGWELASLTEQRSVCCWRSTVKYCRYFVWVASFPSRAILSVLNCCVVLQHNNVSHFPEQGSVKCEACADISASLGQIDLCIHSGVILLPSTLSGLTSDDRFCTIFSQTNVFTCISKVWFCRINTVILHFFWLTQWVTPPAGILTRCVGVREPECACLCIANPVKVFSKYVSQLTCCINRVVLIRVALSAYVCVCVCVGSLVSPAVTPCFSLALVTEACASDWEIQLLLQQQPNIAVSRFDWLIDEREREVRLVRLCVFRRSGDAAGGGWGWWKRFGWSQFCWKCIDGSINRSDRNEMSLKVRDKVSSPVSFRRKENKHSFSKCTVPAWQSMLTFLLLVISIYS